MHPPPTPPLGTCHKLTLTAIGRMVPWSEEAWECQDSVPAQAQIFHRTLGKSFNHFVLHFPICKIVLFPLPVCNIRPWGTMIFSRNVFSLNPRGRGVKKLAEQRQLDSCNLRCCASHHLSLLIAGVSWCYCNMFNNKSMALYFHQLPLWVTEIMILLPTPPLPFCCLENCQLSHRQNNKAWWGFHLISVYSFFKVGLWL